jgi:hypothetical protein
LTPLLIVCPLKATMLSVMKHGVTSMPRKLPPFVECWRDRHGKVRVYYRKGRGRRIPLPSSIGSDEFNVTYQAALTGHIEVERERRLPDQPGTIAALITSYMRGSGYVGLRATTIRDALVVTDALGRVFTQFGGCIEVLASLSARCRQYRRRLPDSMSRGIASHPALPSARNGLVSQPLSLFCEGCHGSLEFPRIRRLHRALLSQGSHQGSRPCSWREKPNLGGKNKTVRSHY